MSGRTKAVEGHTGSNARDSVVTGMGFCLPGEGRPVFTAEEVWDIAGHGRSCLLRDGVYHGPVHLSKAMFEERLPGFPGVFARHFTSAHRFGLVSLAEACADAGLDLQAGDLATAAILAGRGGVDAQVASYQAVMRADPATISPLGAMDLFIGTELAVSPSDVALVQGAVTRSTGPCYTVSCGCASSAVQLGHARRMIADGVVDMAVVTGVDVFDVALVRNAQRLLRVAQEADASIRSSGKPALLPSFDRIMRPYDRRADCVNYGEGSVTLVLESRERAHRRGAHAYGQILAQATTRDGLANPLSSDESGTGLVAAVRACLGNRWSIEQIPYIHGGSDGDAVVTAFEVNAVRQLYGPAAAHLLMTSQEGCFGHNGAPAGCLGVALTLLMMERGEVCPTANCEEPAEGLVFDPVPGVRTRPLDFHLALNFTYQIGGVKSAVLLGSLDAPGPR
ncbi:beta-ketoacyl synthase N-terminal-like domain-containing protein [Streptomyces sp. NBC_01481]|uniref:beta-ketoacyl synthase N-terminal-like domain-containing protein n=1 Tax=Streptomyces sp. NBC_01481 TaxID=2975869 RepID=UPI002256CF41|nr:beta-ketoacyl synthase N-terminal-like domain-containing protein [Streptomyces sp. NBC_01481]MCX4586132.1 ketoacyl synthase [Streptomyces sp. NBC_01481]